MSVWIGLLFGDALTTAGKHVSVLLFMAAIMCGSLGMLTLLGTSIFGKDAVIRRSKTRDREHRRYKAVKRMARLELRKLNVKRERQIATLADRVQRIDDIDSAEARVKALKAELQDLTASESADVKHFDRSPFIIVLQTLRDSVDGEDAADSKQLDRLLAEEQALVAIVKARAAEQRL